jgi:flap endonuclease-1
MGVKNWSKIVPWTESDISEIAPGTIAIDVPNYFARRLAVIRPVRSSEGKMPLLHIGTALGLIRSCMSAHVLPVQVFDGPPELRKRNPNPKLVTQAERLYNQFTTVRDPYDEDISAMLWNSPALRMYFAAEHLRDLFRFVGIPTVTAPTEAEMFASVLCRDELVSTVVSNDSDALLFGSPHVTKQLQFSKGWISRATLKEFETGVGLDLEQLRDLAILCGCDFHKDGVKGVGPRKGVVLLQKYGSLEPVLKSLGFNSAEREDFLLARETFDEINYISSKKTRFSLNPPLIPKLVKFFEPLMDSDRSEQLIEELVALWRFFGSRQATLDQWLT